MSFVHKWREHTTLKALANSVLDAACAAPDFSKIRFLIGMYRTGFRIDFGDEVL
jgi:major membrane immunogen (membrane-anchored lipoprotein)